MIPLDGRQRLAHDPGIAVWRTRDRGAKWERLASVLSVHAATIED